ncbi:MAG: TonB-dependent receptor [Bacteroidota bacterium]
MIKALPLLSALVIATNSLAQNIIEGRVIDAVSEEPLIGATISSEDGQIGTITDIDGQFQIGAPSDKSLAVIFSYLGYEPISLTVSELEANPAILMYQSTVGLDEVIIQASIASKKTARSTATAISYLDTEERIEQTGARNIPELLSGGVPGLQVYQSTGLLGSGVKFNVRAGATFSLQRDPIIFIDGVRLVNTNYTNSTFSQQDAMSSLNDLNVNDIERIEVLKGAAAAASYGVEAANGVVLITTKRGQSEKPVLDFRLNNTFSSLANGYRNLMNSENIDNFYHTGVGTNANLSVSGKSKGDVSYFTSLGYNNAESHVPGNVDERLSARLNLSKSGENFEAGITTNYVTGSLEVPLTNQSRFSGTWNNLINQEPWTFLTEEAWRAIDTKFENDRFFGSIFGRYSPVKNLNLRATLGYDQNTVFNEQLFPFGQTYGSLTQGSQQTSTRRNRNLNIELGVNYLWELSDRSDLRFALVSQTNQLSDESSLVDVSEFPAAGITGIGTAGRVDNLSDDYIEQRTQGYYGEINYAYQNALFLTVGLRNDQSNLVGNNVSSIWYPQANAAYVFDNLPFADLFKLRAALGESGRLPHPNDALTTFQGVRVPGGSGFDFAIPGNPDIKPERTTEVELGFDWSLGNHSVNFTYYDQQTENSIIYTDLPPSLGSPTTNGSFAQNVGSIEALGIEFSYQGQLFQSESGNFSAELFANLTYQENEVTSTGGEELNTFATTIREGLPVYAFFNPIDVGAEFNEDGEFAGSSTSEAQFLGTPFPEFHGSFGINLDMMKNLRFSAIFNYATGFEIYNISHRNISRLGDNYAPRVTAKQTLATLTPGTDEYIFWANELGRFGSARGSYTQAGDFIRLNTLSITYDFTSALSSLTQKIGVDQIQLSVTGRNLWLSTNYGGPDPEIDGIGASTLLRGILPLGSDWTTVPHPRVINTTLQIRF